MAVFRVEKTKDFTIMSNHHLRNTGLSLKAKGLLSLMLSLPEDWDYTTKGLAHICKDGVDSITTALKELERHGYLTRQRLRYDNGQLGDIEYTIHEQPVSTENTGLSPKRENPRQVKPEQAKPKQAEPEQENPAQLNTNPLKTKKSKKDKSITYPSIYPAEPEAANRTDGMDRIELIEAYREIIKENIEYDLLVLRYGRERLDEALELMLEVILSKRPYIRIAGDDFPREIVKSRFLKINSGHLEYVFDCIDKNTTKVGNNVFNHRSNIQMDQHRVLCFQLKSLGKALKEIGLLIMQDAVWNRVTANRSKHKTTWFYIDEFHLLLKGQTGSFSVEIWKRFRKWGGIPSGLTQNVKDLLASREIENIFENSDFIYMLNQAQGDRQILAKQLGISPHQLSYVTHSDPGEGLLFFGNVIIPFVDHFPKDTLLYSVLTTRPDEVAGTKA